MPLRSAKKLEYQPCLDSEHIYYYHTILEHLYLSLCDPIYYHYRTCSIIYHTQLHAQTHSSVQYVQLKPHTAIHNITLLTTATYYDTGITQVQQTGRGHVTHFQYKAAACAATWNYIHKFTFSMVNTDWTFLRIAVLSKLDWKRVSMLQF